MKSGNWCCNMCAFGIMSQVWLVLIPVCWIAGWIGQWDVCYDLNMDILSAFSGKVFLSDAHWDEWAHTPNRAASFLIGCNYFKWDDCF